MADNPPDGSAVTRAERRNDPLYYAWTAAWSWLTSSVVLLMLVVSFTTGSTGVWVHLAQVAQAVLLVFLVWIVPAVSAKHLRTGGKARPKQSAWSVLRERVPGSRHVTFGDFLVRWLRLLLPRDGFEHEYLRLTPTFILIQIFFVWERQTSGRISLLLPTTLTAIIVLLMITVVPLGVLHALRRSDTTTAGRTGDTPLP